MGNKCCGGPSRMAKKLKREDNITSPEMKLIREAQQKYMHTTIESESEDDLDNEDSVDLSVDLDVYGSTDSLDWDGDSVDDVSYDGIRKLSRDSTTLSTNGAVPNGRDSLKLDGPVKRRKANARAKLIRLSKRRDFFSILNTQDKKARAVDPKMYSYPFENIVFEGGGNKGLAYCGCVRLLEDLGVWPQIKRIAGSSAGAMTAALLVVGYTSHDLEKFFSLNLDEIFLDHKFGYLSLLPNLLTGYGWNPGNRIYKWFGHKMKEKTNNENITFKQVYEQFNRELCVVVTNLNQMTSLYCHPKTTPDMPVRLAVRMSMSIPGMFQAVKHSTNGLQTDIFVDGGVLCNYPIHCFDGWWLSMDPEDSFLEKLQPLEAIPRLLDRSERFGTQNNKTLGFQLYADHEQDLLKYQLENLRQGVELQELPNTKLAREKIKKKKMQMKTNREHRRLVKAMNAFLFSLRKHNTDRNDTIDRKELEAALDDTQYFPLPKRRILFGDIESHIIGNCLDKDKNGQISYNELVKFMEQTGISMQDRFLGYDRKNIKNVGSFFGTLQSTLLTNIKRVYVRDSDLRRTVGINTGHIGTTDFVLEPDDVSFIIERGRRSLESFLKYYVASHNLCKKSEFQHIRTKMSRDQELMFMDRTSEERPYSDRNSETLVTNPLYHQAVDMPDSAADEVQMKSPSSAKSVCISDDVQVLDSNEQISPSSVKSVHYADDVELVDKSSYDSEAVHSLQEELERERIRYRASSRRKKKEPDEILMLLRRTTVKRKTERPQSLPMSGSSFDKQSEETEKKGKPVGRFMSMKTEKTVDVVMHNQDEESKSPLLDGILEESIDTVEGDKS